MLNRRGFNRCGKFGPLLGPQAGIARLQALAAPEQELYNWPLNVAVPEAGHAPTALLWRAGSVIPENRSEDPPRRRHARGLVPPGRIATWNVVNVKGAPSRTFRHLPPPSRTFCTPSEKGKLRSTDEHSTRILQKETEWTEGESRNFEVYLRRGSPRITVDRRGSLRIARA